MTSTPADERLDIPIDSGTAFAIERVWASQADRTMNHANQRIARHLTVKYLLTLTLLGGLAVANYLILATQIHAGRAVEDVVSLSGRQRALLHRSALLAMKFATAEGETERRRIRTELLATVAPMEETHHKLIRKDAEVPPPASVQEVYFDAPWLLDTEMRNFIAQLRSVAETPQGELANDDPRIRYLWQTVTSGRLTDGLEAVVSAYRSEARSENDRLQYLAAWSLGSTAALLGISGWFVFRPMVHRVRSDMDALASLNATLEDRVAERTALAENRAEALAMSERAFREQSRLLQSILDNMGDGVVVTEKDSEFRLVNPRAREIFHLNGEEESPSIWETGRCRQFDVELFRTDGATHYPTEELPFVRATHGELVEREEIVVRHNGTSEDAWVSVTARPLPVGETFECAAVAVVRDITERIRAEQRLRDSEALYHSLVDNLPLYVLRKDLEGCFTFVNQLVCRLLERPPEDLLGKTDFDLFPQQLAEKYRSDDQAVVDRGDVVQDVEEHQTPDGRRLSMEILKAPVRDGDGQIIGTQTVFIDVTARVEAERKLLQAERLAAIGQMVAGVAHESRNALQQIQACCGLLGWQINGDEEAQELIQDVEKANSRLRRLFDDLRDYAAPTKLDRQRTNVREVLKEAWEALECVRKTREASLEVESNTDDADCIVDELRLEQVFRNIFENALAACTDPAVIQACLVDATIDDKPALEVAICDNGPGMNPEQREKIFDPFFTTKSRGTGLGMAITRRIVEAHGGRIAVMPSANPGTEILITIPRGAL